MKYTDSHEWILVNGDTGKIGITDHAQQELGEVVYIELPEVGRKVTKGEEIAVLESTKAASDIYAPVSGTIIEVNGKVKEDPTLLNRSSENEGWVCSVSLSDPNELEGLLEQQAYLQLFTK